MRRIFVAMSLVTGLLTTPFMPARQSEAALGEPAASVAVDRKALSATQRAATTRKGYTVQELVTGGNTVREYIAPSGIVFAVAWNGVSHPDLTLLLGSYLTEYKQALRQAPRQRGQRRSQVKANQVVVEKWGHMRNLQGRAYVPGLVPDGVTINEIK
ncbi:hypothetical protein GeomeDRAFT_0008 [Geobacter metallireducens RCH3]|uniref:DUF2844 domain-containing protein n=1 Tax=Geobacter metallireducens (strain ATCC 53774 / DSM 7210 / GS-15) TaxID=269799 RepID=Q39V18_GEOMG|nr:DUF2844 domain-containing protein [Geobacter metallireducens]ABB31906.1 protein of unknown function DUF2844 [Geobacter metallireducens GS-15]EHP89210.1 hypothetical protein GeomeDRAFT_0008 [Geobacter metallireducens RCH3]